MAGNGGIPNDEFVFSTGCADLETGANVGCDKESRTLDLSLSHQLDVEINKLREMVRCLESLERALDSGRQNKQTTPGNEQTIAVIDRQDEDVMERAARSGIPIPRGCRRRATPPRVLSPARTKKPTPPHINIGSPPTSGPPLARGNEGEDQDQVLPEYSPVGSPPKTYAIWPESFEETERRVEREVNGEAEEAAGDETVELAADEEEEQMEDGEESYAESVSAKSTAHMYGGQAIIRRIPTPSSQRRPTPTLASPPDTTNTNTSSSPDHNNRGGNKPAADTNKVAKVVAKVIETNVDDILESNLRDITNRMNEVEKYDNVEEDDPVPTYEQFISGEVDTDDEEMEEIKIPKPLSTTVKQLAKSYAKMDYTVVGTITPLNGGEKGDNSKEEMSFVLGRPASPMVADSRIKRCLSPPYETQPATVPVAEVSPLKKMAAGFRSRHLPPIHPNSRGAEQRSKETSTMINNAVGILCEGCNNCLLDLKRQALRLMYPDNVREGEPIAVPLESIENIKDKLTVSHNAYRFSRAGQCEVCDAHVTQIKSEAVSMVHSIQAASQRDTPTNLPNLIGSINATPSSPRKIGVVQGGPHIRYRGTKGAPGPGGSYLSKSAPIAIQAQAYLEQNVRARGGNTKRQMLMRQGIQDKPPYQKSSSSGDMYPQGTPEGFGAGPSYARQAPHHHPSSSPGSHFINTPYMQQQGPPASMQQTYHQQSHQNQQQQFQQYHQQHPQYSQQQQQQQQHQQQFNQQQQHYNPHQQHQQQPYSSQQPQSSSQPQPHSQYNQQQQQQFLFHQQQLQQQLQLHSSPSHQHPGSQHHFSMLQQSHSAPGSPARIQSPPPRIMRISSPPPSMPSRMTSPPMSPPPTSASPAASFFARAAQKLSKKKKRHHQPDPEPPPFPTKFSLILRTAPPPCPPCLLRNSGRSQAPGVGKVKVMLRVVSTNKSGDHAGSFLNLDPRNKQVTVHDPAASGYATSMAHRKAAMAPKMFAFDGVYSPDESLTEVCSGSLTDIIQGVVAGADGCLFSYGYSKLGKSYTMIGCDTSSQTLGIIPCAISWLFKIIGDQRDQTGARFSVRVSAVEVSGKQEVLKDLLADVAQGTESGVGTAPGVYLREDPISGTQLENQSELRAPTAEKAAYYLDAALNSRTKSEDEGRSSHLLFTLHVYQYRIEKENKAGLPGVAGGRSRLHFIDLGSASKSKDPNNVALSLSALGNVIMALLNGQRHVPHRDSKVAQLLRDSLGNITCRTCMIAHVSQEIPHYNESLQVVQLAARIHRMRRRKVRGQFSGTSSDDSSTDGSSIRSGPRPYRGFRMGTLHEGSSLSDPDYTSSSEQSCDTVIYLGKNGQSLSDRELTDHEGPPRSVPRTNPRLPRRASGSRSSGDEGSNSDSGRSLYRSSDSLTRLPGHISSPVRDVSVTSSRQGTPVRSLSRGATPVRDMMDSGSPLSSSPNSVTFNLPRKQPARTKSLSSKQDSGSCYASVNIVDKYQKGSRTKRSNSCENKESEQWVDGPGAAIYPERKHGEQWIDGPASFLPKQESKKTKMNSEEMWIDGPPEMLPENQTDENQNRTPKMVLHTTSKKANVRPLSSSPKHQSQSPSTSPGNHKVEKASSKVGWPLKDMKDQRPDSSLSYESVTSNAAQPGDSRPNSMVTNPGDAEDLAKLEGVKPFVRDWVEKHGLTDKEEAAGAITDADDKSAANLDAAAAGFRRSKPLDSRTKKLLPASSTPKNSPHHTPKHSPSAQRKARSSTPKLARPQIPIPGNQSKRVTDWLRNVENSQSEESLYMEGIVGKQVIDSAMSSMQGQEFDHIVANLSASQDISSCSSVYPDTTLNDSRTPECTEEDITTSRTGDLTADIEVADTSFDSSVEAANSPVTRDSLYEQQMDEQLERVMSDGSKKCDNDMPDNDTFSTTSCSKDSDMDVSTDPFVECMETLGNMKKSDTIQSVKTLLGDQQQDMYINQSVERISENAFSHSSVEECENVYSEILESDLPQKDKDIVSHILSRKPDGASNPNLMAETFHHEKTNISALREEYLIANAISSQSPELSKKCYSGKVAGQCRPSEGDGQVDDGYTDKYEPVSPSKPPLPLKPCSKCGYSQTNSKTIAKMCKECQKMVALSIKNSHTNSSVGRREKDKSKNAVYSTSAPANCGPSGASKSSKSKSQSPSHSRLPIFSKNLQMSSKDLKLSRKKEKECKKSGNRSAPRGHDSDSGNDSGIVAMEKTLLSPYATVTKPRTVSHSSSGHGSDNSSNISTDLISKQGSGLSGKQGGGGGTSSGYESMLRDSEGSGSSTAHEDSASEQSSGDKKKGSKKKRMPSTRRSRSAPARSSESPDSSSRKSSPSSKNSSLSPASKAWIDKHKTREEPLEIKDYDADDVKRMTRHRAEEEKLLRDRANGRSEPGDAQNGKEHYIVDRSNSSWSFDSDTDGSEESFILSSYGYHRV